MSHIVAGASYAVYDRDPTITSHIGWTPGGIGGDSTYVSLYNAEGQLLVTVKHKMRFGKSFIDPSSPLPHVASYRRIWYPAIDLGGLVYGCPGYAVMFHDKHGHRIGWQRLESDDAPIVSDEFDLTNALEETPDFSHKPTAAQCEPGEAESSCSLQ